MSAKSEAAARFRQAVVAGKRCTLWKPGGDCDGPLDGAHYIPAQRLRAHTATLPEAERLRCIYDPRVARPLCRKHHHQTDHGFIEVFREDLPPELFDFAREWDLMWSLTRDYHPRDTEVPR